MTGCSLPKTASSSTSDPPAGPDTLSRLLAEIRACRICLEQPQGKPLPHPPRPVLRASAAARIGVFGQAPGVRVNASGVPFSDPSGVRLREWMGVSHAEFYDETRIAIVPMGFCFPGHDAKGGDLPPRRECARAWREQLMLAMPRLEFVLLVGSYAQAWHLPSADAGAGLSARVEAWRCLVGRPGRPAFLPLPHPSWRNNAWLKAHPWFAEELLPELRRRIRSLLQARGEA